MGTESRGWEPVPESGSEALWVCSTSDHLIVSGSDSIGIANELRIVVEARPGSETMDAVESLLSVRPVTADVAVAHLVPGRLEIVTSGRVHVDHEEPAGDETVRRSHEGTDATIRLQSDPGRAVSALRVRVSGPASTDPATASDRTTQTDLVAERVTGPGAGVGLHPGARPGFRLIGLEPIERDEPLPIARESAPETVLGEVARTIGKRCAAGHFNHPGARYCAQCGRGFAPGRSEVLEEAPRPSLGVLVDATGQRAEVDLPIVVGRQPEIHPEVEAGSAIAMTFDIDGVSRIHAVVRAEGWSATVTDLSKNGTFEAEAGGAWRPLERGRPAELQPGGRIRLGTDSDDRLVLRFLSHHLANP